MATSVDELLDLAQHAVWQSAQTAAPSDLDRRGAAAVEFDRHRRAWPMLGAAAQHALTAMVGPRPGPPMAPVLDLLERAARPVRGHTGPGDGDPRLLRAAALLGAAGDALHADPAAGHHPVTRDRVLTIVDAAAVLTGAHAEQAHPHSKVLTLAGPRYWLTLSATAQDARSGPPGLDVPAAARRPIVPPGEESIAALLHRFHHAATTAIRPTRAPTRDLMAIPRTLALLHRALAHTTADPNHQHAASAWRDVVTTWGTAIRSPGPPDPLLRAAVHDLAATLTAGITPHQQATAHRYGTDQAADLARDFHQHLRDALNSELYVTAARHLARVTRPAPTPLAAAARAGRWIPLPRDSPPAGQIREAAALAGTTPAYAARGTTSAWLGLATPVQPRADDPQPASTTKEISYPGGTP